MEITNDVLFYKERGASKNISKVRNLEGLPDKSYSMASWPGHEKF
jgi:hypothetical protein